jgi:hypothetical protein
MALAMSDGGQAKLSPLLGDQTSGIKLPDLPIIQAQVLTQLKDGTVKFGDAYHDRPIDAIYKNHSLGRPSCQLPRG